MASIHPRAESRFARSALVGAVLPVAFALVNQRLVAGMIVGYAGRATALACAALLAEMIAFGWLSAKFIEPARARWLGYAWMWGLIDFTVVPRIADGVWWGHPMALLVPAMLSVQLVLVALWAVFGASRWSIRWPVAGALLVLGAGIPVAAHAHGPHQVVLLLTTQAAVFLVACVLLYWWRFRMSIRDFGWWHIGTDLSAEANQSQFFVRDLLLWMTLAAGLLGFGRQFVLLSPPEILPLAGRESGVMCLTGIVSALVLVAAIRAMLGQDSALVRWARLAAVSVLGVVSLGVYYYVSLAWRGQWPGGAWHPLLGQPFWSYFLNNKWHLLGWIAMSAAMLMASLVFFRVQGYRLTREARKV